MSATLLGQSVLHPGNIIVDIPAEIRAYIQKTITKQQKKARE